MTIFSLILLLAVRVSESTNAMKKSVSEFGLSLFNLRASQRRLSPVRDRLSEAIVFEKRAINDFIESAVDAQSRRELASFYRLSVFKDSRKEVSEMRNRLDSLVKAVTDLPKDILADSSPITAAVANAESAIEFFISHVTDSSSPDLSEVSDVFNRIDQVESLAAKLLKTSSEVVFAK